MKNDILRWGAAGTACPGGTTPRVTRPRTTLNGWLILDKPTGISSAKAVSRVKHLLKHIDPDRKQEAQPAGCASPEQRLIRESGDFRGGKIKIGHAGTLDPLASGILPLALGEATKTAGYMVDSSKAYSFTVTWGEQRDTDDSEGEPINTSLKRPTRNEINNILQNFIGNIAQMPPQYSAIKVKGQRAYALARSGQVADIAARNVQIDSLEATDMPLDGQEQERTSFICHCGKGTYIRSIARDMGTKLGCLGYITALRRLKVGKFEENHAISLELLEEMVHKGDLSFLLPVESALDDIPALGITPSQAAQLKQGKSLTGPEFSSEIILAKCGDTAVAICRVEEGQIKPIRVFNLME